MWLALAVVVGLFVWVSVKLALAAVRIGLVVGVLLLAAFAMVAIGAMRAVVLLVGFGGAGAERTGRGCRCS